MSEESLAKIDPTPIKVDPIFIATQFERINVTLEFFGKLLDKSNDKAEAQDKVIDSLVKDMTEVKSDIRVIKDSKPKVIHPAIFWSAVGSSIVSAIAILSLIVSNINS